MEVKFHLALPCKDLLETRWFYENILELPIGRSSENWMDVNLFGNQITFTSVGEYKFDFKEYRLGKHILPSFHFGVIVDQDVWGLLYTKLFQENKQDVTTEVSFMENKVGEHISFFVKDPNGYTIEFKCFKNSAEVFLKDIG